MTRILAERCASTAMIYLMHVCATQVIAAAAGVSSARGGAARRRRGPAPQHPGLQREGLAQPFLGAGQPGGRRGGHAPADGGQVVRDQRRPRRQLRRLHPQPRAPPSRWPARSTICRGTCRASASAGRGTASACAATPVRRCGSTMWPYRPPTGSAARGRASP